VAQCFLARTSSNAIISAAPMGDSSCGRMKGRSPADDRGVPCGTAESPNAPGGLYLFAHRPEDDALMVLSVERIRTINVEDLAFTKDPDVRQRIEDRRQRAFGIIDDGEALSVTLKFTAAQAPYIRERV